MPGRPAALAQLGTVVDMEAGILLALGEDPCPKLEDVVSRSGPGAAEDPWPHR